MRRLLALLLLSAVPAGAAEPSRLGALLRAYLKEEASVARQEELLAEIRRVSDDDPALVAASLRAGEHRRYEPNPAFRDDGPAPEFRGRNYRCDSCAEAVARSAGQYATLHLPPGYDPARRYPLVVHLSGKTREPEPDLVLVVLNPRRHPQAARDAVALERLVLGVIAHTMGIANVDPARVFLRGGTFLEGEGAYAELAGYIAFQNPDRFAGLLSSYGLWLGAEDQAAHAELFRVVAVTRGRNDSRERRAFRELRRLSSGHRHLAPLEHDDDAWARVRGEVARWQQDTKRARPGGRLRLVCVRPLPLRCHWIRAVPKTRSRRDESIARAWTHPLLPRPATLNAEQDERDRNLVFVEMENLVAFQIYVDPAVFDVAKPLRVSVNGSRPTAHVISPDIGAMLDDYRERGDPDLLYVARLSFP